MENMDKIYDNIKELITYLEKKYENEKVYYRGQTALWDVTPTIRRPGIKDSSKVWERNLELIDKIREVGFDWFTSDPVANNWFGIFQQYGRKTDLIDFTTDLNVAEYFAISNKGLSDIGCIYVLDSDNLEYLRKFLQRNKSKYFSFDSMENEFKNNSYNPIFDLKNIKKELRVYNQQGVFLWDYKGIYSQLFKQYPILRKYRFYQTDLSPKYNSDYIYPNNDIMKNIIDNIDNMDNFIII